MTIAKSNYTKDHQQHNGELFVQKKRHVSPYISKQLMQFIDDEMPLQHEEFFSGLSYFVVATLDEFERPWASIIVGNGEEEMIRIEKNSRMKICAKLPIGDPFGKCFGDSDKSIRYFAGLGIDFSNRRRNKVSGLIETSEFKNQTVSLNIQTNESLGNCPKYITIRNLSFEERTPQLLITSPNSTQLSPEEISHIHQASTIFIATRHLSQDSDSDIGLNHRGGNSGFCRIYHEENQSFIIIPDYSGNRFYQSLGNVQSDRVAGLVIPNFMSGDLLYITGEAENLFDEQAELIMPRVSLITRIRVTGHVFVREGLNLKQNGPDQYSPYNPPIHLLRSEMKESDQLKSSLGGDSNRAKLSSIEKLTPLISRFNFKLDYPIKYNPGSYAVFDFNEIIQKEYQHMNNSNPKSLNDDLIRTWTISSAPNIDESTGTTFQSSDTISCTIKLVENGAITPFLHSKLAETETSLKLIGVGGNFTCFDKETTRIETPHMIWIAAGVGITPFLSMWSGLQQSKMNSNVKLSVLYSGRGKETELIDVFRNDERVCSVDVFDSSGKSTNHEDNYSIVNRRISEKDIEMTLGKFSSSQPPIVYLCGPPQFMNSIRNWLSQLNYPENNILTESFGF